MGAFCSDCFKGSSSGEYETIHSSDNVDSPAAPTSEQGHSENKSIGNNDSHAPGFFIKYELRDIVGVGSTANCHRCARKSDGKEFACKVIDKRQIEVKFTGLLEQFHVEIKVLEELNHPHIIKLEDVFETPDRIFIVMELMDGGELFDYVVEKGMLNEEEASVMIRKITSALAHMHSKGIIHRDLKPENLLLTSKLPDAEIKLIDFGLAKKISNDTVAHSFLGTRGYLAPEMLQRHAYDKAIDVWALGIIVFVLLCGCLPFDDDSSRITSEVVARKKFALRFPRWASNLSPSAKELMQKLLDVNPKTRITAEEALRHPWVTGVKATPNNYLQSPSVLGERRKELKSPAVTGGPAGAYNRLVEANTATVQAAAVGGMVGIKEEGNGKKKQTGGAGQKDYGQADYGTMQQKIKRNDSI